LRQIAKVLDLSDVRQKLTPYYSAIGLPSLDPERMIRMLLIGYLYGTRSERRLVEEVHLNLAYRWFCGLGLAGEVPNVPASPRRGMDASVKAKPSGSSSRAYCKPVCAPVWSAARRSPRMQASLRPTRALRGAREGRSLPTIGTIRAGSRDRCANISTSWTRPLILVRSPAKARKRRNPYS
jgi:hypothetical protein